MRFEAETAKNATYDELFLKPQGLEYFDIYVEQINAIERLTLSIDLPIESDLLDLRQLTLDNIQTASARQCALQWMADFEPQLNLLRSTLATNLYTALASDVITLKNDMEIMIRDFTKRMDDIQKEA